MAFRAGWLAILIALAAAPAAAEGWLALPVDCRIGETCWPLQYVDHDPGPEARDYRCGGRAYDGHSGTDIGLGTEAEIARDVPVLAAASGKVRAVRDGEPDGLLIRAGRSALPDGRDCGNAVVLVHERGWETQYCHMARGSIAVRPGDEVAAGARLGAIGLSGLTEFPHLHFAVRRDGVAVDPFRPEGLRPGNCAEPAATLWTDAAASALAYSALDLVAVGLAAGQPDYAAAKAGRYDAGEVPATASVLSAWALAWNVRVGDRVQMRILGPNGAAILDQTVEIARDRRHQFLFVGRRANGRWPVGDYRVETEIRRGGGEAPRRREATGQVR